MTWISRAWSWLRSRLALVAAAASVVLLFLWRLAMGQRDAARRERDDAQARAEAAAESARRTERLRADEALAAREAEAALVEVEARRDLVEDRLGLDRARVEDADLDALAREIEARREAGRMR